MGVGSSATGNSILVVNEQTTYETWEFLYDPRVEKLRAAAQMNAGAGSVGAGGLGQTPGGVGGNSAAPNGFGNSSAPNGFGNSGTQGTGGPAGNGSGATSTTQP